MQVPDDLIQVGYVSGAYGVTGSIRVAPFSADADALLRVKTWWLDKPGLHAFAVRTAKRHGGAVVSQLAGVVGRDASQALKGATVSIRRSQFPELPADQYYWTDLIGLEAVNVQGEVLGPVVDMMDNGAQSILCIAPAAAADGVRAAQCLIPYVDQYVKRVDLAAKRITVDWGLDY